ncbi:MAG: anion permease, partial [Alphaproteobacteria bacterium]|nr:anion permease [Alphaproteobacteria bacterium]
GVSFEYGEYLALNFPVMGLMGLAIIPVLITLRFRDQPQPATDGETAAAWTRAERMLLLVVLAAIALWATDFLHGTSPAWVALGAAVVLLLPRIGILPPSVIVEKLNLGPWFMVAGVISMGAVVTEAGLGKLIAEHLIGLLDLSPGRGFASYVSIVGLGIGVGTVTTLPAAPAVMSPLAEGIASASGWPLKSVLLAQVPAWMAIPFPHLAPPLVAATALGGVSVSQALRFLLPYLLFTIVILLPIQYLWGRLLGFYP